MEIALNGLPRLMSFCSEFLFGSLNHAPGDAINRDSPSRQLQYPDFISAFGSTADMARPAAGLVPVENDPERKSAVAPRETKD
jgi:hypothetical protein